jgi:hypothetical protein
MLQGVRQHASYSEYSDLSEYGLQGRVTGINVRKYASGSNLSCHYSYSFKPGVNPFGLEMLQGVRQHVLYSEYSDFSA